METETTIKVQGVILPWRRGIGRRRLGRYRRPQSGPRPATAAGPRQVPARRTGTQRVLLAMSSRENKQ